MARGTLSDAVAKKYQLAGGMQAGQFVLPERYKRISVDWTTMTLEQADALVARFKDVKNPDGSIGFCYLKPKEKTATA